MLYVVLKQEYRLKEVQWQVEEKLPLAAFVYLYGSIHEVVQVHADGDELLEIDNNLYMGNRVGEKKSVCWFGDDAKFIVANL